MPLKPTTALGTRTMVVLLTATGVVFSVFVVIFAAHRVITPMETAKEFVDIGGEGNLPTWWNSKLLAIVAAGAVLAAWTIAKAHTAQRRAWYVVGAAALYLSVDEAAEIHERFAGFTTSAGIDVPTYAWVIPGTVAALVGVIALIAAGRHLPRAIARRLGLALALYGTGALGVEAVNGAIKDRVWGGAYTLGTIVEESLEIGACALAIVALVDLFAEHDELGRAGETPTYVQPCRPLPMSSPATP